MTDQNKTAIGIVLDRSGSMSSIQGDAEGAMRAFIKDQREVPGEVLLWYTRFDDVVELVHRGVDLRSVDELKLDPRNMTALYDAIGTTVNRMGEDLAAMSEDQRPGKVLVAIITDGLENASRDFDRDKVNELITRQRAQWAWDFVFLAANQDAMVEGASIGVAAGSTFNFQPTSKGVATASSAVSAYATSYRVKGKGTFNPDGD